MKVFLLAAAASLVGLFVAFLIASSILLDSNGRVRIVNAGTERITGGKLLVAKRSFTFQNLNPGEDIVFHYKPGADSHYKLTVDFESGRALTGNVGYVTAGLDSDDVLEIKDTEITLSSKTLR